MHAVAGRRDRYQPLRIPACPDADPVRLAEHYRGLLGAAPNIAGPNLAGPNIAGLYVADLDRITDHSDSSQAAIGRLVALGLPIWIDRGIETAADCGKLAEADATSATTWIVATESLRSLDELRKIVQQQRMARHQPLAAPAQFRSGSLAVSLDLREGRVVSASEELAGREPLEVAELVAAAGVERLIVLDVARVGTRSGPSTAPLCRRIKQAVPQLTLCSGGGVRDAADAAMLRDAGCDFVLAGTWLHGV